MVKERYERYGIQLRLVNESDAGFIVKLRTDDVLGKYLSASSNQISDQENWIRNYKIRESKGEEYYFIVFDEEGNRYGTTRIYNIKPTEKFTLGSWLFSKESPSGMAIKADMLTREIGYIDLGLPTCEFDVRKANKTVLKYHQFFKPERVGEDEDNYYFSLHSNEFFDKKEIMLSIVQ